MYRTVMGFVLHSYGDIGYILSIMDQSAVVSAVSAGRLWVPFQLHRGPFCQGFLWVLFPAESVRLCGRATELCVVMCVSVNGRLSSVLL